MKKTLQILFITTFLVQIYCPTFINSQTNTWEKIYIIPPIQNLSQSDGYDICKTDDENYYVISSRRGVHHQAFIAKINVYGDSLWAILIDSITAYTSAPTLDNGVLVAGIAYYPFGAFMLKINSNGEIAWLHKYSENYFTSIFKIIRTWDGGFVACGSGFNYGDGLLFKINSNGDSLWCKDFVTTSFYQFNGIIENTYRDFLIYGGVAEADSGKGLLLKTDSLGNTKWLRSYYLFNRAVQFNSLDSYGNKYIILATRSDSLNKNRIGILKVDENGDTINSIDLQQNIPWNCYGSCIKVLNNNKIILSYMRGYSLLIAHAYVDIIDSSGNIFNEKEFRISDYTEFNQILPVNDGYLFVGNSDYYYWINTYVVKTDLILNYPPIGINETIELLPYQITLSQNFPNPFNPITKIKFSIPQNKSVNQLMFVSLKIYDILGRELVTLVNSYLKPGNYESEWDANNFASGIYFYKLQAGDITLTKKMTLIK